MKFFSRPFAKKILKENKLFSPRGYLVNPLKIKKSLLKLTEMILEEVMMTLEVQTLLIPISYLQERLLHPNFAGLQVCIPGT